MRRFLKIALCFALLFSLSSAGWADGTYSATSSGQHAIEKTDGATSTYENITVTKTGDYSSGSEDGDFYGLNAAILSSNGSTITIKGSSTTITTDATYGNAVQAYGGTVNISDATITTSKRNSGGIMTTGGGTMNASNLTITL